MCQDLRAKFCNASHLQPGETFEKCEATCCEQDMCNGLADNTSPSANASPSVNPSPSVNATPSGPVTSVPVKLLLQEPHQNLPVVLQHTTTLYHSPSPLQAHSMMAFFNI